MELSIVLVILGLLTGGILAGQSLIRAAELRAVVSEYQRFTAATNTFRDQYMALPGDMANATRFWGKDNAYCASDPAAIGTPGTCNGNGDGKVTGGVAASSAETFQYWKQLALAGLIEGTYSGISGPGSATNAFIGINVPGSHLTNAGWTSFYLSTGNTSVNFTLATDYGNLFAFGANQPAWETGAPVLKPEEAWNIDSKIDDGRPAYGKVIARYWNNACTAPNTGVASTTNLDASYRLDDTTILCALFLRW